MILQAALLRAYDCLGDRPEDPRFFSRAKLLAYANRGCLMFRAICNEVWYRLDMPVIANQGEYTKPTEILEMRRVAYDDETLEARTVTVLQSRDPTWQTTTGPDPIVWTTLGFSHDKFFIWPKPTSGSPEVFVWNAEHGTTVRYQDTAGGNYTFTADPALPALVKKNDVLVAWNPEHGILGSLSGIATTEDYGDIFYASTSAGNLLTLWGSARPATLVSDDQEIPIRRPWQMAVVWFILWQVYEEEGDHHNSELAAYYRDQFADLVNRCKQRSSQPVPGQVRRLRGGIPHPPTPQEEARWGDAIIGGNPVPIIWPAGS